MASEEPLRRWGSMSDLFNISPAGRKELWPYVNECATLAPPELEAEMRLVANMIRNSLQHDGVFVD